MKVEDIQIGDWVQNPLGAPYQVFAIHFYKINGDGDGYYGIHLKNKGAEARLEIYDLHPIPLTPEILKKNGFGKTRLMGEQSHFTYYIGPSLSLLAIYDADFSFRIGDGARKVLYVHQLQHILRLCGIDKEIVL